MTQAAMTIRTLERADRCDRCGAAAALALHFKNGELMFCTHHYNENHPALLASGALVCGTVAGEGF